MRILNLIHRLSGGGTERQLSYLAPELAQRGHDVHIAYLEPGPQLPELSGIKLHRLIARSNSDPYLMWRLFRLMRSIRPDIVQTWILQMDILGGIAARLSGLPWILREPSSLSSHSRAWKQRLRVRIASGASAIVSNSRGGDMYWEKELPDSPRFVVPNGLPLSEIASSPSSLPEIISNESSAIMLYVGRLASDLTGAKNPRMFLEALADVRQHKKVVGVLCGDGPMLDELTSLRHDLGLDGTAIFLGHVPRTTVWQIMKAAAVYVSLSAYEGCPNAVLEAMACGCPLAISDIPGHRELVDETCAAFIKPITADQTSSVVQSLLADPTLAARRAESAQQRIGGRGTAAMAKGYEEIYRVLTGD